MLSRAVSTPARTTPPIAWNRTNFSAGWARRWKPKRGCVSDAHRSYAPLLGERHRRARLGGHDYIHSVRRRISHWPSWRQRARAWLRHHRICADALRGPARRAQESPNLANRPGPDLDARTYLAGLFEPVADPVSRWFRVSRTADRGSDDPVLHRDRQRLGGCADPEFRSQRDDGARAHGNDLRRNPARARAALRRSRQGGRQRLRTNWRGERYGGVRGRRGDAGRNRARGSSPFPRCLPAQSAAVPDRP